MNTKKTHSGETLSCWMEEPTYPPVPLPKEHTVYGACIVGAGIAGLSTAYHLAKSGRTVVVVDAGPLYGGQSNRTTAHLSNVMDERLYHLIKMHGEENAALIVDSHRQAVHRIEEIVRTEKIDCDFLRLPGYLFNRTTTFPDLNTDILGDELDAYHRIGYRRLEMIENVTDLPFYSGPALKFQDQAQFHPVKYMNGLAKAIEAMGGRFYTHQKIKDVKDGAPAQVEFENGSIIEARSVIVATNTPINDRFTIHTKQYPYRTYAVAANVPKGSLRPALYWDTDEPYHYIRLMTGEEDEGTDTLIIGGEDHKTGQEHSTEERFIQLEDWARDHFPDITGFSYRWSGQIWKPADGIALIGKNPGDKNIYIVTGDSGMGMTHGTIAGILLRDLIMNRRNAWEKIYDPARKPLFAGLTYLRENLNTAWQYTDYLKPGEVKDVAEILPGHGAVLQHGLKKVAVYRDETGQITQLSAICPHLGGVVHWNGAEKSWDCPCHGARFSAQGEVITGPANQGLKCIDEDPIPTSQEVLREIVDRPLSFPDAGNIVR